MPNAEPASLSPLHRLLAERACERLIAAFVRELDLGDPAAVADLFTADGVWEWPDGDRRIEGRDALRAYFGARPADRLSRRVSTNVLVTLVSPTTASATSYFTTYRVDGHGGGMVPARAPVQVGHYEDSFRQVGGRWLLATRTVFLAFAGPTERLAPADHPAPPGRAVPPARP
ncbi:nuclear transport factor 2 family protein [Streptomyces sp. 71268]|uniref:nuclear transport factor 2 family protein n=1 Tax=Streptomyces sp. 71268 TaxID=3002640 RepID=UPI0023F6D14F|nr:nuclear transport factor 2 family protein [Streptomyces sp. 71268]WEV29374.1 nuclear transport factor 2 family protein [Streptomyces sp. 71268]